MRTFAPNRLPKSGGMALSAILKNYQSGKLKLQYDNFPNNGTTRHQICALIFYFACGARVNSASNPASLT